MSEGNSCDGDLKKRNALGDVTNLVGKRDFSADLSGDAVDKKKCKFVKQACSGAENIENHNILTQGVLNDGKTGYHVDDFIRDHPEREHFFSEISKAEAKRKNSSPKNPQHGRVRAVSQLVDVVLKDTCVSSVAKSTSPSILDSIDVQVSHPNDEGVGSLGKHCVSRIAKPTSLSVLDSVDVGASHLKDEGVGSLGKRCVSSIAKPTSPSIIDSVGVSHSKDVGVGSSGEHCVSSIAKPTSPSILVIVNVGPGHLKNEGVRSLCEESTILPELCDTDACGNDETELDDDNLDSSKCESTNCFRFPESQESRSSGFERCIGLKSDGLSDSPVAIDLIKTCSCSFCTKAAYIWSDLHYQDIKGRLAALKKSQKEANVLVQKCSKNKSIDIHGQGKPDIQSSLNDQWRSLFLHMEGVLGRESSQLEAGLFTLKDVRDNCKTELESINGMPSGNP